MYLPLLPLLICINTAAMMIRIGGFFLMIIMTKTTTKTESRY